VKLIQAFLRLIRWQNLFFIVLTQALFYYCMIIPVFTNGRFSDLSLNRLPQRFLWLLIFASVCIAAAGYIINDYFDLDIDQVNKPDAIVIQRHIKRRFAIIWHLVLSLVGVALSFYIGWKIGNWVLGVANFACVLLLWIYSTTFKKRLLIGNIVISLLTAWVILVIYVCELNIFDLRDPQYQSFIILVFKSAVLYGGFAFIISLIREVIKDVEDREGDARYGGHTMPIVWGLNVSKVFVAVWLIILIVALLIIIVYGFLKGWWMGAAYTTVFTLVPLIDIFRRLFKAVSVEDFHSLSTQIKLVMLTGILSMVFFKWYL
jgi:4-hydroxybenzoate polyprenyltransferase